MAGGLHEANATTDNDEALVVIADGSGSGRQADVVLDSGVNKLATQATVTVEQLLGQTLKPITAITIDTLGSNGDTVRVEIPDDSVDVTSTKTASETDVELMAQLLVDDLNADGTFSALYEASRSTSSNIVCIEALETRTERPDAGDVVLSFTGTMDGTLYWDTIIRRGIPLQVFPSPDDCRLGSINIGGGEIVPSVTPQIEYEDMNVSAGGIARGTTIVAGAGWSKIYEYVGKGLFMGLLTTVQDLGGTSSNFWSVRLVCDSNEIFGSGGLSLRDISHNQTYNFNTGTTPSPTFAGLNIVQNTFRWTAPNDLPLSFKTSVQIYIQRTGSVNKVWRAGLSVLLKK